MTRIILFSLLVFPLYPAYAQAENYEDQFAEACAYWQVPSKLALAIARQESGLNPWAVNIAGRGFMPKTREEAQRLIDFAWTSGYSFDVGLMQVNSWWLRKFGLSPSVALEPRNNVFLGVWILSKEIERHGLTWQAVASYHTPLNFNPERGRRYAASVIRQMTRSK